MERRKHEFGMYLMMGMDRKRLFSFLAAEEMWSSLISLVTGIPIAVFISEIVSLVTAKLVGMNMIGHHFSFSLKAVAWTIVGYCLVRALVLMILSIQIVRKDLVELLADVQETKQKKRNQRLAAIGLILGVILIGIAFCLSITGYGWEKIQHMLLSILIGTLGIFMIFHGASAIFDWMLKKNNTGKGLAIFDYRQLQEAVFLQPNRLAIACILLILALGMSGYGVSNAFFQSQQSPHILDYTFEGDGKEIQQALSQAPLNQYFDKLFQMKEAILYTTEIKGTHTYSAVELNQAIDQLPDSEDKDVLENNFSQMDAPYMVPLSSYNAILQAAGKEQLVLEENETALYVNMDFHSGSRRQTIQKLVEENLSIELDGESYQVRPEIYGDALVTDRAIQIMYAWILPDDKFDMLSDGQTGDYWNATLQPALIREKGLMQAMDEVNAVLDTTTLVYESYLKSIGRALFYKVAASYTAIYLAVIFLLVANTGIGVQFLMLQRKNSKRYQILTSLGCTVTDLCHSAGKQMTWYFMFPVTIAVLCSFFASWALLTGAATSIMRENIQALLTLTVPVLLGLLVVEWIYMRIVRRMLNRSIERMTVRHREDD